MFRKLTPDVLGAYARTPVWRELLAEATLNAGKKRPSAGDKMTTIRRRWFGRG